VANSYSVGAVSTTGYKLSPTVIKNCASSFEFGSALDLTVSIASKTMFGSCISLTQPKSPTTKKSIPFLYSSSLSYAIVSLIVVTTFTSNAIFILD